MPTWKRANPKHQPLKCSAGNHLWRYGLALAIYNKAGALTNNGDPDRTFFAKRETLTKFFGSSYNAVCNAVKRLRKDGWLLDTDKENHYLYVSHEAWEKLHPGKCVARDLVPYQEEADPFVGKLFALAHGSLRVKEHWVVGMRKLASEEVILEMFAAEVAEAKARRKEGKYTLTSPSQCLYRVTQKLKALKAAELKSVPF